MRGERRLWAVSGINSHTEIREHFNIRDNRPGEQVNLEALPTGDFFTDPWVMHVDHDGGDIPEWFTEDKEKIERLFSRFVAEELAKIKETKKYGGSLDLGGCTALTSLPSSGLSVGGSLSLRGCTGLTSLPSSGLSVGGDLYLYGCTALTSLPSGLSVDGYLDLGGCTGLTSLPSGLSVGGSLDLGGCTGINKSEISKSLLSKCIF
jgi:hypothetical protein